VFGTPRDVIVDLERPTIEITTPDEAAAVLTPSDDLDPTRPWLLYDFVFRIGGGQGGTLVLADEVVGELARLEDLSANQEQTLYRVGIPDGARNLLATVTDPAGNSTSVQLQLQVDANTPPYPAAGEMVFTEIMFNPGSPLSDAAAEWVEIASLADGVRSLHGCVVGDDDGQPGTPIRDLVLQQDDLALFVSSPFGDANGRLQPDGPLGVPLGNGGDLVRLSCEGTVVDEVDYDEALGFPFTPSSSLSLAPRAFDAAANDLSGNWCPGPQVYFGDPAQQTANWGSPGLDNPPCEVELDSCSLHRPLVVWGAAGQSFVVSGRVSADGVTDRTHAVDEHRRLVAAAGVGLSGVAPDDVNWFWYPAEPNTLWDAAAERAVGSDEYQGDVFCPGVAGEYDFAFRFSDDGGQTWTYCDTDGSGNGFDSARTGDLTVE